MTATATAEGTDRTEDAAYIAAALSSPGNPVGEDAARRFWEARSQARGCDWIRLDNVGAADLRTAAAGTALAYG